MTTLPIDSSIPDVPPPHVVGDGSPEGRPGSLAPPPAFAEAAPAATRADIERAVARANEQMANVAPLLQFEVDPDTRKVVIRLVDRHDMQVLRQVPSPEMLEIARALDRMQAHLVRGKA